jgi:hypothetical protein
MRRIVWSGLAVATIVVLLGLAYAGEAEKKPDATLKMSEGSVAAGIGWSWGKGTLTFKGKTYPFKVEGLTVGEVGVTKAEANGKVYNLKKLEDFNGIYSAAAAGATVGGGGSATAMKNENGVEITLLATTKGINVKLAGQGVKLTLTK